MLTKKFFKTKNVSEVTFEFSRKDVKSVSLLADFNDWQPMEMRYNKKEKAFRTKVRLSKTGNYCFRYLLDDSEWENDYQADKYVPNDFGSENSVLVLTG